MTPRQQALSDTLAKSESTLKADTSLPVEGKTACLPTTARGTYQILGQFAQGGIGRILEAHDPILGRTVALKELLIAGHSADEQRFVR